MIFINGKIEGGSVETIDEFTTYKEAKDMLVKYRMCMPTFNLWLSQKATKDYRESS